MATVYIHIGAPKTATSTLQAVFSRNYKKLLKQGVLYPQGPRHGDAHHLLVCDLIEKHQNHRMADFWYGDKPRGQAWESLKAEMTEHEAETVIVSSELFFGQTKNIDLMHQEILTSLKGHEIKIVVYLRRQDQLYSSFFNQDVKGVRQWPHSAYQFYDTHQIFEHDYHSLLNIWSEPFGKANILIRPYEASQWTNGDIVQDFCELLEIAPLKAGRTSSNPGLGANQLYIKQCLNRVGFDKSQNEEVVQQLLRLCPEEPTADSLYVRKRLYRQLRKGWMKVNHRLEHEYLKGEPLFRDAIPTPDDLKVYKTDKEAVAKHLQTIVEKVCAQRLGEQNGLFARAALLILAEQDLWSCIDDEQKTALMALV